MDAISIQSWDTNDKKKGLSKYVPVETLIALPFMSVEICVHEFDSITVL